MNVEPKIGFYKSITSAFVFVALICCVTAALAGYQVIIRTWPNEGTHTPTTREEAPAIASQLDFGSYFSWYGGLHLDRTKIILFAWFLTPEVHISLKDGEGRSYLAVCKKMDFWKENAGEDADFYSLELNACRVKDANGNPYRPDLFDGRWHKNPFLSTEILIQVTKAKS